MGGDSRGQEGLNDLPFGGKAFVELGDFRQVVPVICGASGAQQHLTTPSDLCSHYLVS